MISAFATVGILGTPYSTEIRVIRPEPAITYLEAENTVYRERIDNLPVLAETPLESPKNDTGAGLATSTIKDLIVEKAKEKGVNPQLALNIAVCESGLNQYAKNKKSSAESYFQFLDSTWIRTMERMGKATTTSKFDPEAHIEAAAYLLKNDGTRHWEESRRCWSRL